jgi:hypothetical protein
MKMEVFRIKRDWFLFLVLTCGFGGLVFGQAYWCPDLSADDFVDLGDFALLAGNWQESGVDLLGDFDGSGTVDNNDLQHFIYYWLSDYECRSADFNFDYIVNFIDFAGLANLWLSDVNDVDWDDKYDLDYSDFIDGDDLHLLSYRWLKTYPEPNDIFDAFRDALSSEDIEIALTFVAESSKNKYDGIFQAIGSNLPDFAAGMGTLILQSQDEGRAVYEMTHQDGATTYSFPVVFIKDDDGNWKICNF